MREQFESVCQADLDRFGSLWDFDKIMQRDAVWSEEALRSIAIRSAMRERIRDLTDASNKYRRRVQRRGEELRTLQARVEQLEDAAQRGQSGSAPVASQPAQPLPINPSARIGVGGLPHQTLDRAKAIGQRLRRQG